MRKNKMFKKRKIVNELIEKLYEDDTLENVEKLLIGKVTYAPHIGYRAWIFKYKGVPVCLWDEGNGHYGFHSAVSHIDILVGWLYEKYDWYRYKKKEEVV